MPMPGRSLLPSRTDWAFGAWTLKVTLRSGETSVDANSGGRFPCGPCARAGIARPEHAIISQAANFVTRVILNLGEETREGWDCTSVVTICLKGTVGLKSTVTRCLRGRS